MAPRFMEANSSNTMLLTPSGMVRPSNTIHAATFGSSSNVDYSKIPDHLTEVMAFLVAEVASLILLSKLFGCRMRMLKMTKAQIKAPAVLALFMTLTVYLLPAMAIILQPAVFMGASNFCAPSAHLYTAQYILGKLLLFAHLIERFHATRACQDCYLNVGWAHRLKGDCVWCVLMVIGIVGTVVVFFCSSIMVTAEFDPLELECKIKMPTRILIGEFVWIVSFYLALALVFFWIMLCTVNNFTNVRDVPDWQYKLRQWLLKATPDQLKKLGAAKEQAQDCGLRKCPAYLCPLETETAGALENLAIKGSIAALLSLIPTIANFAQLFLFRGHQQLWIYVLSSTIDVSCQALVMHILSNYPGDRCDEKLAANIKSNACHHHRAGISPSINAGKLKRNSTKDEDIAFWHQFRQIDNSKAALVNRGLLSQQSDNTIGDETSHRAALAKVREVIDSTEAVVHLETDEVTETPKEEARISNHDDEITMASLAKSDDETIAVSRSSEV